MVRAAAGVEGIPCECTSDAVPEGGPSTSLLRNRKRSGAGLQWNELQAEATCAFVERGEAAHVVLLVVIRGATVFVDEAGLKRQVNAAGEFCGDGSDRLFCSDPGAECAAEGSELTLRLEQRLSSEAESGRGAVGRSSAPRAQHPMTRLPGPGSKAQP